MIIPKKKVCDFCGKEVGINRRYYIIRSKDEHIGLTCYKDNKKHHVCWMCMQDIQKYINRRLKNEDIHQEHN